MKNLINLKPNAFNNRTFSLVNRVGRDINKYIPSRAIRKHNVPDQLFWFAAWVGWATCPPIKLEVGLATRVHRNPRPPLTTKDFTFSVTKHSLIVLLALICIRWQIFLAGVLSQVQKWGKRKNSWHIIFSDPDDRVHLNSGKLFPKPPGSRSQCIHLCHSGSPNCSMDSWVSLGHD